MKLECEAELLRIFVGEKDKHKGKPVFEVVVAEARRCEMAGATVLRGLEGFGANRHMHSAKVLALSENLPLVIEIVDTADKIGRFVEVLDGILSEGLVTREKVRVTAFCPEGG